MLISAVNNMAMTRPGAMRPLPARSIRAHASSSTDPIPDSVTVLVKEAMETITSTELPSSGEVAAPQPPTSALPSAPAEGVTEISAPLMPKGADLPQSSNAEVLGQETLDMRDILPDVKAAEVEPSVADKVESMFNKASNVFQKLQPESQADKVPESSAAVSDNFSMAEKLQGMKDAAAELVKAPAQNGGISVPPDSSAPVTATPTPTLPSVPDAIASKIQPLQEAVQDALTAPASTSITVPDTASAGSAVMSAVESTSQPAGPGVISRAIDYTDDMMDRAEGMVGSLIDSATGQASSMMQSVGEGVANSVPKSLPPNLQDKADVIGGNIVAAKAVYDDAPGVYLLLATLAIGSTAYAYWKFEFGGYKGVYRPVDLLEALNREDNVFLVDIRPEEDLKEKGVLDLKRGARGKATHLPLVDVPDAVKGDIANSQLLQLQLNAALVTSLNEVNRFTKIVVMDSRGLSVKGLARAITEQGYRGYMLGGGFSAWKTGGLATKFGSYTVTPADLLADKGEELSEAAEQTAEKLRQPRNAAFALLTFASAVAVYLYPHESFRLIGVLGIELTILVKLLSYDSPSAAVEDVGKGFQSIKESFSNAKAQAAEFAEVAQARSSAAVQPSEPKQAQAAEVSQKSSPVSEARESVAAEAVKEAQAALERMVAQTKEEKPPPVPAPQANTKPPAAKPVESKAASISPKESNTTASKPNAKAVAPLSGKPTDSKPVAEKGTKWPADGKKDEVMPPKPVVDSLPYVSADEKAQKRQKGPDGAKPATKGK